VRVLYGVCGDGMGHAIRSAVVAEHLLQCGHELTFVTSGRAKLYLESKSLGKVNAVIGLNTVLDRNRVDTIGTISTNIFRQIFSVPSSIAVALPMHRPDVIISDFDPWSANYASITGVPLVAVDNVHFVNRCWHPPEIFSRDRNDRSAAAVMYPVVSRMVPRASRYLVTTFVGAPLRIEQGTSLHYPIVRPEVFDLRGMPQDDHVTAYFNDKSDHAAIVSTLNGTHGRFHLYGTSVQEDTWAGNVLLRPFSFDGFMQDVASSEAVLGGAGFTFISEALVLGKPMLAVPFEGQYEQILNSNYLEYMGYGARSRSFDSGTVNEFLERRHDFQVSLNRYHHEGNAELFGAVDRAIVEARR
jgi:uncharacterized protein (TIGR00661 family)